MAETACIKIDYAERFSRKNPPLSREVALDQVDELEETITSIESQLQFKSATDFVDTEAYRVWKDKAIAALAHSRGELRYLEKWLSVDTVKPEVIAAVPTQVIALKTLPLTKATKAMFQQDVMAKARTLTSEIVSALDEAPETFEKKLLHFRHMLQRLEQAMFDIAAAGNNAHMSRRQVIDAKQPLLQLRQKLILELSTLKIIWMQQGGSDWKTVCRAALLRAEAEGFVLTSEEKQVLTQMDNYM